MYEKVKAICEKRKISISQLENDLKFSRGSICKWSAHAPSVDKVKKVADYLKVDINKLI